jgi:hypothetical protein
LSIERSDKSLEVFLVSSANIYLTDLIASIDRKEISFVFPIGAAIM